MALDIGELLARLRVDEKGMDKGLKKGESKFKDFGDKVTKLTLGIGIAAAGALAAGLLSALDQQAVGAKIAANIGQGTEEAQAYGKTAGKLYAEGWGESVQAIGDTLKAVASSGIIDPKDTAGIEDLTRRAEILSEVLGQDVTKSVRAVQQLLRNGLVPDAQAGFDLIAAGIQGGIDKSDDLLDTVNEYSTQFRELGLTGQQAFGLLQQAVQAGARDTDTAADALKEFAIRSKDASTTSAAGFKALGLDAQKFTKIFSKGGPEATAALDTVLDRLRAMKDPVAQNTAAVALFGTKAEDLGNSLFAMDLDSASQSFSHIAGTVNEAGKAVQQTDSAKLEQFKRQALQAAAALGADLIPYLKDMAHWIKENESWLGPTAAGVLALAAAITIINLATKAWAAATAAWEVVTGAATAVQWAFNAALLANPITWIIIAVIALVAIIVLIATKTDWFQRLWGWAWGGIKTAAMAVWNWIKGTLWPGMKAVFEAIGAAAMWLYNNAILPAWNSIKTVIAFVMNIIISFANLTAYILKAVLGAAFSWLYNNAILPAFQSAATVIGWFWNSVLSPIVGFIWGGLQLIGAGAMWLWNNALAPAFRGIGAAAMWLWNSAIMPAVSGIGAAFSWLWGSVISPVWNFIKSGAQTVGDVIRNVFSKVSGWIASAFSGAVGIVRGAMNGVISAINGAISGINWVIDKANSVPGVNFPNIPQIPHLATGGAVNPTRGGTPVVMGDGGEVEYGVPKSDMRQIIGDAVAAGGGHGEMKIVLELVGDGVLRIVRTEVKRNGVKTLERTP